MDGKFTRNYRLVTGLNTIEPPLFTTYYGVVTRESVILGFLIAALKI